MAYGAYSIAAPQMSLQEELMKRRSSEDPSVDIGMKKKSLQEDLLEQLEKKQRRAQKRAGSFLGVEGLGTAVTTALDVASSFMPGPFGAVTGGISGLISGYNEMRAADKLGAGKLGKEFGKYKFLQPQLRNVQAQAKEQKKDIGDVLTSAGVGALKGFTAGQLGQLGAADKTGKMVEATDAATKAQESLTAATQASQDASSSVDALNQASKAESVSKLGIEGAGANIKLDAPYLDALNQPTLLKGAEFGAAGDKFSYLKDLQTGQQSLAQADLAAAQMSPMDKFGTQLAERGESMFNFEGLSPSDQMQKIALLTQNFSPLLQGLTAQRGPQLNLSGLY